MAPGWYGRAVQLPSSQVRYDARRAESIGFQVILIPHCYCDDGLAIPIMTKTELIGTVRDRASSVLP